MCKEEEQVFLHCWELWGINTTDCILQDNLPVICGIKAVSM